MPFWKKFVTDKSVEYKFQNSERTISYDPLIKKKIWSWKKIVDRF